MDSSYSVVKGNVAMIVYGNIQLLLPYMHVLFLGALLGTALHPARNRCLKLLRAAADGNKGTALTRLISAVKRNPTVNAFRRFSLWKMTASIVAIFALIALGIEYIAIRVLIVGVALSVLSLGFFLALIYIFRKRVFVHRFFMSDEYFVSVCLVSAVLSLGAAFIAIVSIGALTDSTFLAASIAKRTQQHLKMIPLKELQPTIQFLNKLTLKNERVDARQLVKVLGLDSKVWTPIAETAVSAVTYVRSAVTELRSTPATAYSSLNYSVMVEYASWALKAAPKLLKNSTSPENLKRVASIAQGTLKTWGSITLPLLTKFSSFFMQSFSSFFDFVLFYFFSIEVLQQDKDAIEMVLPLLYPSSVPGAADSLIREVRNLVEKIVFYPLWIAAARSLTGFALLQLVNANAEFLGAFGVLVFSIVAPSTDSTIVLLPWILSLFISQRYFAGALVLIAYPLVMNGIEGAIADEKDAVAGTLISISLALGAASFGIQGLVFGPLMVTLLLAVMKEARRNTEGFPAEGTEIDTLPLGIDESGNNKNYEDAKTPSIEGAASGKATYLAAAREGGPRKNGNTPLTPIWN